MALMKNVTQNKCQGGRGRKETLVHSWRGYKLVYLPTIGETWVRSLGQEDPLEKRMAIHSSVLAWRIPWTEEPRGLQSTGPQRVGHDWATNVTLPLQALYWAGYRFLMKRKRELLCDKAILLTVFSCDPSLVSILLHKSDQTYWVRAPTWWLHLTWITLSLRTSTVAQWLGNHFAMQGTQVRSLICYGTKIPHAHAQNYWVCSLNKRSHMTPQRFHLPLLRPDADR